MQRVLVTGAGGFLGSALVRSSPPGVEVHGTRLRSPVTGCPAHDVDLADRDAVRAVWAATRPGLVVHTAYRMHAGERDIGVATANVVEASVEAGAALIHVSTDLVLDGERAPYDESARPAPVNEYGRWKARAEAVVAAAPDAAVVRTSLLTSFAPLDPRSAWVARGLEGAERVRLFTDEIRCPIGVDDVAAQIWEIAALGREAASGVWNLAGPEALSRYALGLLVADALGLDARRIEPAAGAGAAGEPRPRDLRLLTGRADRTLRTRPRPISALAAAARVARGEAGG